ncbi:BQ2448_5833 [Microbotryum intermedium]|uniref:BQ2448_5833 protein n=1 Tax=Microbotryum intermedium TaxID=269621 RepID=A0A238F2C1_9BASI|nr:BQ2448_5833 [Microbotryum intermedium]
MSTSDDIDLDEVHRFASHLAILAGVYLGDQALQRASRQSGAHYDLELTIKENAADLVTKADKHAEEMISTAILQKYPQHKVYVATGAVDIFWEGGRSLPIVQSWGPNLCGNLTPLPLTGCWEWDVCAGTIIVNEAGGRVVPSQCPPGLEEQGDIPEADLGSRLYLAIRPCASTTEETATQAQDRLIREVWRRCEKLDYVRPQ